MPEDLDGNVPSVDDLNTWVDDFGVEAPVLADDARYSYAMEPKEQWPAVVLIDRTMRIVVERLPVDDAAIRDAIEAEL